MIWWLWIVAGLVLLVVEMVTPGGLFALFFGAAALLVAPLSALGVGGVWQWLLFSVVSLALLATVRRPLQDRLARAPSGRVDSLVGEEVVLLEELAPGATARAELRGSPWSARTASVVPLRAGQRCRVVRVDGLTLWLRADAAPSNATLETPSWNP
jgi:inner membrane protein